ncbi:unnamed protein product [Dicrocoelium dendriticum]|nr:unnamed protein product [Dicrocoelium dendriticum]
MEYNLKMLQFYLGLYGFAAFLCLLGYVYALVDWQLKLRRQRASGSASIPSSSVTPIVEKTKAARHIVRFGNTTQELISEKNPMEPEESVQQDECHECPSIENASSLSMERQHSWNKRRAERRQRYKEEKHTMPKVALTPLSEGLKDIDVMSQTESSRDELSATVGSQIPPEILAEHEMCSRRESVQVTDLDEKFHTLLLNPVERLSTG